MEMSTYAFINIPGVPYEFINIPGVLNNFMCVCVCCYIREKTPYHVGLIRMTRSLFGTTFFNVLSF